MTTSHGHPAAHLAKLAEGRSARRLTPRISTTSVDANAQTARRRRPVACEPGVRRKVSGRRRGPRAQVCGARNDARARRHRNRGGDAVVGLRRRDPGAGTATALPPEDRWTFVVTSYLWAISLDGDAAVGGLRGGRRRAFQRRGQGPFLRRHAAGRRPSGALWGRRERRVHARLPRRRDRAARLDVTSTSRSSASARTIAWSNGNTASRLRGGRCGWFSSRGSAPASTTSGSSSRCARGRSSTTARPGSTRSSAPGSRSTWPTVLSSRARPTSAASIAGSDLSWNVQGFLGYRTSLFGQPTTFTAGYRALYVDYDHNEFKWDVTQQGPILGVVLGLVATRTGGDSHNHGDVGRTHSAVSLPDDRL